VAVSFVGSTTLAQDYATSLEATSPSGLADGDTLLAAVYARSAITTPSGWTKLIESTPTTSFPPQRTAVFSKNSVSTSDASAGFTFAQADEARIGITYIALRGVEELLDSDSVVINTPGGTDWAITPGTVTATSNGQAIVVFASSWFGGDPTTPTPQTSFTLTSGASLDAYRLAGSYRLVSSGQSNSGDFNFNWAYSPAGITHLTAITLLLGGEVEAEPIECHISADGPLGAPSALSRSCYGWASVPGPLGYPAALARSVYAAASASSPLSAPAVVGWHDFTGAIDETAPLRYVCDLTTPDGTVRVPISSWQATLQTDISCYSQCVIPAVEPYVDAIIAATHFAVYRQLKLIDGSTLEYLMTEAEPDAPAFARGPYRYTCTLSGYSPALVAEDDPSSTLDRTLQNVRQTAQNGSTYRVQCDIDVMLRPGHRAFVGETSFVVRYINYVVNTQGQSMQVGSASNGA
jgi:hypothetical protein